MSRDFRLLWAALLLLGCGAASAQDGEHEDAVMLPDTAADETRDAAQLPAETTIRLMQDADRDDIGAVMHDIELPVLPDRSAAGQRGVGVAAEAIGGNEARERGRADDARDNAADAAENARDRAEDRGRADDLPANVPDRPERPDTPKPPGG